MSASRVRRARALAARVDRAIDALGPGAADDAARGALFAFDALGRVLAALGPIDEGDLAVLPVAVNPEAGRHAMPSDPRVLAAAIAVARAAWARFPYLARRFGDRGARFTTSDGCWLATLVELPGAEIRRQLAWLRGLLARRGLPGLLLDDHLARLAVALRRLRAFPPGAVDAFEAEARALRARRDAVLPAAAWAAHVSAREARLAALPGPRLEGAAELVVGAACDEADGLDGSLGALRGWLGEAFAGSTAWLEALDAIADEALDLFAPHGPAAARARAGEARP